MVGRHDDRGHQLQVARQDQQVDSATLERGQPLGAILVALEPMGGDAAPRSCLERCGITVAEHEHHVGPRTRGVAERQKVAAAARDRHCHAIAHSPSI